MSNGLKCLIREVHELSQTLCGTFINYLCRYLVEADNFSDVMFESAVTYRYFFEGKLYPEDDGDLPPAKRLFLDRDDLGQLNYFLKEEKNENVRSLEADIVTMETKTKEALLKWFQLLPEAFKAYNKKVKDCRHIFVWSIAHPFWFHRCKGFERIDDILQAINNVDLTAFSKFIQKNFPLQKTFCGLVIGNEDISGDVHFVVDENEISEIKVSIFEDDCFFSELIGHAALANHVRKLDIAKISILNVYKKTYNVYDISQWKQEDRERFYLFLTNETLLPLSDY